MKNLKNIVLLTFLVSCASPMKFNKNKKVEIHSNIMGITLKQDGKAIETESIKNILSKDPSTKDDIKKARIYEYTALPIALYGGFQLGTSLSDSDKSKLYQGVGFSAIGLYIAYLSDEYFLNAVKKHNKLLEAKSSNISPLINKDTIGLLFSKSF